MSRPDVVMWWVGGIDVCAKVEGRCGVGVDCCILMAGFEKSYAPVMNGLDSCGSSLSTMAGFEYCWDSR